MKPRSPRCERAAVCAYVALFGLALGGCSLLEGPPPFQYLSAKLVKGEEPGCHRVVGVHFSIRNVCTQVITVLYASFDLYDADGMQLPAPGSNHFDLTFTGAIAPDSTWAICTSLDSAFYFAPEVELVGERFRVYRVELADGSTWSDPFALYSYPYPLYSGEGEPPQ